MVPLWMSSLVWKVELWVCSSLKRVAVELTLILWVSLRDLTQNIDPYFMLGPKIVSHPTHKRAWHLGCREDDFLCHMWVSHRASSKQGRGKWFPVVKPVSSNHLREACQHPRDLPFYYLTKTLSIFSSPLIPPGSLA